MGRCSSTEFSRPLLSCILHAGGGVYSSGTTGWGDRHASGESQMVAFRAFLRRIAPFAVVALLFALALPAGLPGQEAAAPCSAPEYRQFDFWLGEWEVTNPSGEI